MATQRIDFILSASQNLDEITAGMSRSVNRFKKDLKGQIEETKGAASSTAKFKHSMKGLAASIGKATAPIDDMLSSLGGLQGALKIGLIVAAGKKLIGFAESGAVLEAQLSRLGNTAEESLGKLEKMQIASGGVFSLEALAKAEIMQKELGVQLNFTGKDLEKLDARFTAMGMDGANSLEQVITSLARSRKSFLQVLGLVKDLEGAYKRYARAHDVDRRTMSEVQKREALIAEVKLNIQGIDLEAGRSVAAFEQMNAAFSDAFLYLKLALAPVGKLLKPIAVLLKGISKILSNILKPALELVVEVAKPFLMIIEGIGYALNAAGEGISNFFTFLGGGASDAELAAQATERLNHALRDQVSLSKEAVEAEKAKNTAQVQGTVTKLQHSVEVMKARAAEQIDTIEHDYGRKLQRLSSVINMRGVKGLKSPRLIKESLELSASMKSQTDAVKAQLAVRIAERNVQIKTTQQRLKELVMVAKEDLNQFTLKKRLASVSERITQYEKLRKNNAAGLNAEQKVQLEYYKIEAMDLTTQLDLQKAREKLEKKILKIHEAHPGEAEAAIQQRQELLAAAEGQFKFDLKSIELKRQNARLDKRRPIGRKGRGRSETPLKDFSERHALELEITRAKQKHISLERFRANIALKGFHLEQQIAGESKESKRLARQVFSERALYEMKVFKQKLSLKEKEAQLDLISLKNLEDGTQLAIVEFQQSLASLELAKTRNEMTQAEFNTRKEILKVTRDQAIEEDKRQRSAAYWTGLEETMANTSGVMSGMSSNMGTLTNAMAQGAAITSQHIGEKKSWNETTQAGIAVGQQAATAMVEDTQKQAAIAAVFETAKGFVALASGQFAQAGFHFAAAAIFGGIGATSGGDKAEKKQARSRDRRGGSGEGGQIIVNMGSGVILGRPQDIGRAIGQATGAVLKTGMGSSAV